MLNTEADIQDLTFPHSYDSDSILQISALALQQYSNNGVSIILHNESSALYCLICSIIGEVAGCGSNIRLSAYTLYKKLKTQTRK